MTFTFVDHKEKAAKIKVIGVGGAGGNAINNMIATHLEGVRFIVANTDAQDLDKSQAPIKVQIGEKLTEGLGTGMDPQKGRESALESMDALREALADSHMVFIAAGLGGGTGTGAAPVVAQICREMGALTVAVVTKPFAFEGKKRLLLAQQGLEALREVTDSVITIPNDRLLGLGPKNAKLVDMFKRADEVLLHSVKGITDLIIKPGHVNLDFADVRSAMSKSGMAIMGIGMATGDNRAVEAAERAIYHPLLEDVAITGAKGVLMNITATSEVSMNEIQEASDRITRELGPDAEIILGVAFDDNIGDEFHVTVIATGIGMANERGAVVRFPRRENREVRETRTTFSVGGRGKIRDVTPEDQHAMIAAEGAMVIPPPTLGGNGKGKGYKGLIVDGDVDFDIPTFLRRKFD